MAVLNSWLVAAIVMIAGLIPCGWACVRGKTMDRLIALELGSLLTALTVVLLAEGFDRPSLYDIALSIIILSFPSTLIFAHFLERWL